MADADLSHHYKVLKQFLDISDDAHTRGKSSSTRAARAREKLLRLSGAQFRELSTDVYDELRRRIDESRSEPDFLLPRSTFHPKRNQARQKLSSLPQSRFKDLVSDISFEIERRELHGVPPVQTVSAPAPALRDSEPPASPPSPHRAPVVSHPQSSTHRSMNSTASAQSAASVDTAALRDELATPDLRKPVSEQPIGVQSATVVPTKAHMTWSSDEEEDERDTSRGSQGEERDEPRQFMLPNSFSASRSVPPHVDESTDSRSLKPDTSVSSEEHEKLKAAHANLLKEHDSLIGAHRDVQAELAELADSHRSVERELGSLGDTHSQLTTKSGDLAALVERLTHENSVYETQRATSVSPEEVSSLQTELDQLRASHASVLAEKEALERSARDLTSAGALEAKEFSNAKSAGSLDVNTELKKLHDRLSQTSQDSPQEQLARKESRLKNEVSQWQKKYAALKAGNSHDTSRGAAKETDLAQLRASNGLVSYKAAVALFSAVDTFYAALDISNPDADLLFERISSIAVLANKIAAQATTGAFGENGHADALRESASHALTATRYFVVYPTLMPKIIVERAVSEIAFAACDVISAVKLSYSSESEPTASQESKLKESASDEIDVKPLRITQKRAENSSRSQSSEYDSGVATPKEQIVGKRYLSGGAGGLSPVETRIKDQSSPTPSRVIKDEPPKRDASSKQSNSGLLSFKNLFGEKRDAGEVAAGEEIEPEAEPEVQIRSPGSFPSAFPSETEDRAETVVTPKAKGKSNTPSILDKVRQFESQSVEQSPTSPYSSGRTPVTSNGREISRSASQNTQSPPSPEAQRSITSSTDSAPSRNKSIFQSLKERFTSENPSKTAAQADDTTSEESEVQHDQVVDDKSNQSVVTPTRLESRETASTSSSLKDKALNLDTSATESSPTLAKVKAASVALQETSNVKAPQVDPVVPSQNAPEHHNTISKSATSSSRPLVDEIVSSTNPSATVLDGGNSSVSDPTGSITSTKQAIPSIVNSSVNSGASSDIQQGLGKIDPAASGSIIARSGANDPSSSSGNAFVSANEQETSPLEDKLPAKKPSSPVSTKVFKVLNDGNAYESTRGSERGSELSELPNDAPVVTVSSAKPEQVKKDVPRLAETSTSPQKIPMGLKMKSPSFKVRKVSYEDAVQDQRNRQEEDESEEESYDEEEDEIRQRQDYRKSMAAATFNFDLFDIDDPDNTVTQVLLYLEHQTVQVISTIQDLLSAIKKPDATRGELRENSGAISEVIKQMTEATNTSMNQTRNFQLKEHGSWVVKSLEDCNHRMNALCKPNADKDDEEFADRHFKQRLAGISFDIAKCTKELVKTVEEASLKEDIAHLDARLNHPDDLT